MVRIQRERERAFAAQQRAIAKARRDAERARAAQARASAAEQREMKRLYVESRVAEVAAMNDDLATRLDALATLLADTLGVDDYLDFESLKEHPDLPARQQSPLDAPAEEPRLLTFLPAPQTGLGAMLGFGKTRHAEAVAAAEQRYAEAAQAHREQEAARREELARHIAAHDKWINEVKQWTAAQHAEVDAFQAAFEQGDPEVVVAYFELVFQRSVYPNGFPQMFKLAYVPESRQLVVEYELPTVASVPTVKTYRYVRASDTISDSARPSTHVRGTYAEVVAQVTLRTLHEVFEADRGRHVDVVVFNGVLHTTDPGSGRPIKPCLVTVRATKDTFAELELGLLEPLACLRHLSAGVSKNPAELVPVRPVLEFDMVDPRFVAESDALSLLDARPNLMELRWGDFEVLIQNLFTKMGLDAKQTRASRDGGVDCVAYDPRPVFGGKVVIQAKRYKNTVGVSAVRDLFGTLQNEGASKGILVTTSGYGQASFEFAKNKPIELIDGANLLYLLKQHADIDAKIEPPVDWADPTADLGE
ncbi:MAG: restriction endonuclease [Actinomycetota bacterium]|nr:restriction endonuclease [Actinomycetota bacterium]